MIPRLNDITDLVDGLAPALALAAGLVLPRLRTLRRPVVPRAPAPPSGMPPAAIPPAAKKGASRMARWRPDEQIRTMQREFIAEFRHRQRHLRKDDFPYDRPWFIAVGEHRSGKSSLLAEAGMEPMRRAAAVDGESISPACEWWTDERSVVLEPAGRYVLNTEGPSSDAGWNLLMVLLQKRRYRRPIDGVLLTIPARDLFGAQRLDGDALATKAATLHRRLEAIEKKLGMRVPVYAVITGCDVVPGFQEFCRAMTPAQLDAVFGWGNPYTVETAYTTLWVDEAFRSISDGLLRSQLGTLAEASSVDDDLFLFPSRIRELLEPFRIYSDTIFRPRGAASGLIMRGVYLSGDGTDRAAPAPLPVDSIQAPSSFSQIVAAAGIDDITKIFPDFGAGSPVVADGPIEVDAPARICFARELITQKLPMEHRIAVPLGSSIISHNKVILALQIVSGVLALGFTIGVPFEFDRLKHHKREIVGVLSVMHDDLESVRTSREFSRTADEMSPDQLALYDQSARRLLDGIATIDENRLRSPLFPISWFGIVNEEINRAMRAGFDSIVLQSMDRLFRFKANTLLDEAELGPAPERDTTVRPLEESSEFAALHRFVGSLKEFERNVGYYNTYRLTGGSQVLPRLIRYLFDQEVSSSFQQDLVNTSVPPPSERNRQFRLEPFRPRARAVAGRLLDSLQIEVIAGNDMLEAARETSALVGALAEGMAGFDNVIAMRNLDRRLTDLDSAVIDRRWLWMGRETFDPPAPLRELLDSMRVSPMIGSDLPNGFLDRCAAEFRFLRSDLLMTRVPYIDAPVIVPTRTRLALSPPMQKLSGGVRRLMSQGFMSAPAPVRFVGQRTASNKVIWGSTELIASTGLVDLYRKYMAGGLAEFHPALSHAVSDVARNGLEAGMLTLVNQAQRVSAVDRSVQRLRGAEDLDAEVKALGAAAPNLTNVLEAFNQLGLGAAREVSSGLRRQCEFILTDVTQLLNNERLYSLGGRLATWDGEQPLLSAVYDVTDPSEMSGYFGRWIERVKFWTDGFAEPVMSFAENQNLDPQSPTFSFWRTMLPTVRAYENKVPGNSVSILESFILNLNQVTPENYLQTLGRQIGGETSDFFLERRNRMFVDVRNRCRELVVVKARRDYNRLQTEFNRTLAGRYPFADDSQQWVREPATIDEVREFFRLFDHHRTHYMSIWRDLGGYGDSLPRVVRFLDELAEVEQFMETALDTLITTAPLFNVAADFHVNQAREIGGNEIIEWTLELGRQKLSSLGSTQSGQWFVGDPVRLRLRWAKDASWLPARVGQYARLDGTTVTYTFDDAWALLRMIRLFPTPAEEIARPIDGRPNLVKLTVDTKLNLDDEQREVVDERFARARVYLRIGILGLDKRDRYALPTFPVVAPRLGY